MFPVMSVCLIMGGGSHHTRPPSMFNLDLTVQEVPWTCSNLAQVMFSVLSVCSRGGGSHYKDPTTCSNLLNLDFTVQGPPAQDMFKRVQLGTSQYRGNPGLVQICSTWTALYKDFLDMFTLRYCVVHTIGKWAVDNQLKCLLVSDLSTT